MAKINYNGIELEEVTEPQIFNPPKKMLVWNNTMDYAVSSMIVAIVERIDGLCAMCYDGESYPHCAFIPEKPAPRMATNRELARWLAQGNGEWCNCIGDSSRAAIEWWYDQGHSETKANNVFVRKWDDTEWHTPDVEYMSIEEDK